MTNTPEKKGEKPHSAWGKIKPGFKPEETQLRKFLQKINSFFQKNSSSHIQLKGRVHELQENAENTLIELASAKNELKKEIDVSLYTHLEAVIEPLIKEVRRIQKEMTQNESTSQYVQTFKRYTIWIEKAKMWVELCSKRNKKEAIRKAIIDHNIEEFRIIIERDLQIVSDYFDHMLKHYQVEEHQKLKLKTKIEQSLGPYIQRLQELQVAPKNLSLGNLAHCRAKFDEKREKEFSEALHIIDTLVQQENPSVFNEKEGEHYIDILKHIAAFEEKILNLSKSDVVQQKKETLLQIAQLEEEAHHLNLDLRLSNENSERLQMLMENLSAIRKKIEN